MIFDEYSIKSLVRPIPDFPKAGVTFRDITPLYQSPRAMRMVADSLIQRYVESPITHIAAIDARGFLLGSVLAYELNKPLILVRKAGKLPADVIRETYSSEYGDCVVEMHRDALKGNWAAMFTKPPPSSICPTSAAHARCRTPIFPLIPCVLSSWTNKPVPPPTNPLS
jgi:hypothetical protein